MKLSLELEDALTEIAKQVAVEVGEFIIDNTITTLDEVVEYFSTKGGLYE